MAIAPAGGIRARARSARRASEPLVRSALLASPPTRGVMVFYFTCSDPRYTIYMGRDKHENEHLIKYGWPGDSEFAS